MSCFDVLSAHACQIVLNLSAVSQLAFFCTPRQARQRCSKLVQSEFVLAGLLKQVYVSLTPLGDSVVGSDHQNIRHSSARMGVSCLFCKRGDRLQEDASH